ncbi:hypothetical protein ACM39_17700, partial [Chryseobacterium sp. FH2]|uniref:hypothetical protein n=1 Tax=Chryseobacterium sp. FH2 TaxID=1674291 RepID=UPI00065ACABF
SYWYNNGNGGFTSYDGGDKGGHAGGGSLAYGSTVSYSGIFTMGDGVYTLPPLVLSGNSSGWGQQIQSQFNSYMNNLNNNWGANVAMGVTGVMSLPTGGGASAGTWTAIRGILGELAGGLRAGLWSLPLMLNGDSAHAPAYNIPLTTSVDVPVTTTDVNKNGILLYRGISADIHTETQLSMYNEALFGIAIPNGLRPGNKAHWNMDDHARGDNYSVWTSWTSDPNVARDFATNYGTAPGVVLSKRFKVGVNAIPNISPTGMSMQEKEWLIFGPVTRANVQHVKP